MGRRMYFICILVYFQSYKQDLWLFLFLERGLNNRGKNGAVHVNKYSFKFYFPSSCKISDQTDKIKRNKSKNQNQNSIF